MSLLHNVLKEHKNKIQTFALMPSIGVVFEVTLDDDLIFSKVKENRKPGIGEVESIIRSKIQVDMLSNL